MVWAAVAKSAGLQSAYAANKPSILAQNMVRDQRLVLNWTTTGLNAGPYTSDPTFPIERLYDGRLYYDSRPTTAAATHYINFRFTPASIDGLFFRLLGTNTWNIDFQIADNATFSVNLQTVFSWVGVVGGQRRCQIHSNTLYTGVEFARLRFVGASSIPRVGEVYTGRALQLSRKFNVPGYDDAPLGTEVREFRARNRAVTRYVDARGFRDLLAQASPTGSDSYGLNDVASFRSIFSEARHASEPIVYVENPASAPNAALFGFGSLEDRMDLQGPYKRAKDWAFDELPPFLARES